MIKQSASAWAVVMATVAAGTAAYAAYPDLVLDVERKILRAEYLPAGTAPELQFRLFQEKDGKESMLRTINAPLKRGQRAHVEFSVGTSVTHVRRGPNTAPRTRPIFDELDRQTY